MSFESDFDSDSSSDEDPMDVFQPKNFQNIIRISKSYYFLDIVKVYDITQLRTVVAHLSRDVRDMTIENNLLHKFKKKLMFENEKLKLITDADYFYRSKVNHLMTINREALLKLNQQQNHIVEVTFFLEEQKDKFENLYVEMYKQSQIVVDQLNNKLGRLEDENEELQAQLVDSEEKTAKMMEESNAMRQKCDDYSGKEAEKLRQIEGLQSHFESLLNDHQRISEQMADNNRMQEVQIEELQRVNLVQAQKLQSKENEVVSLNEKLTAQNTVVLYQKKLMQELTATKSELTAKLAHLGDELAAKKKEFTDSVQKLKSDLAAKTDQLEKVLTETKQQQARFKQHELEMSNNVENSNRKLKDLQQQLDVTVVQHSVEMASLKKTMDIKQAELQAAIGRSSLTDTGKKFETKILQSRIERFEGEIRAKDRQIADLSKRCSHARFDSGDSVVVPETESQPGTSGQGQPKGVGFTRLKPLILNLPLHDSLDDDFELISSITMQDETDFDNIDGRSTAYEPMPKRLRSFYTTMENISKFRSRKKKSKSKDRNDLVNISVSESLRSSFNFSGITSLTTDPTFPKRIVHESKPAVKFP